MSVAQTSERIDGTWLGNVAAGGLSGTVTGTTFSFFLQIGDTTNIFSTWIVGGSNGTATVANAPTTFSGTFSGAVQAVNNGQAAACSATDHKVTFTRR